MWVHGIHTPNVMLKQMTASCRNTKCLSTVAVNLEIAHIIRPSLDTAPEIAAQTQTTMEF